MNAGVVSPQPKIHHGAYVDRLPSIVAHGFLWCDGRFVWRSPGVTTIGMSSIKPLERNVLKLASASDKMAYVWEVRR